MEFVNRHSNPVTVPSFDSKGGGNKMVVTTPGAGMSSFAEATAEQRATVMANTNPTMKLKLKE